MNANELRIGNLIQQGEIKNFWEKGVHVGFGKCYGFNELNPIPLTEEWLLKFGFKHIKDNWYNIFSNENTFNVYLFTDKRFRIEIVNQSICVLNHVHQLQNLYFALTNKELKINI
jgi:hypothetical protein